MSEDQDSGSSTGLMIGIIAGGVVVLLLVVGAIFGVAFFWMAGEVKMAKNMARDEEIAVAKMAENVKPPNEARGEEGPPWPNPKHVADQEQKVLGTWTATFKDGRTETWEVRADKTMDVTVQRKGQADEITKGAYELLVDLGGPDVSIRLEKDKGGRTAWTIHYLDNDRFVVVPTVTAKIDGVTVKNADDGVPYHRKRAEIKP